MHSSVISKDIKIPQFNYLNPTALKVVDIHLLGVYFNVTALKY
jgi:hypothetical protein